MPTQGRDPQTELKRVFDALADAAFEATDEEILAEAREEGIDLEAAATRARRLLLGAVKREKLRRARLEYEVASTGLQAKNHRIPTGVAEMRRLLDTFFARKPELATAQFRELATLSDADVERALKHLAELGLLDDLL